MLNDDWTPDLSSSDRPLYAALADQIAQDIGEGRLAVGDRLPAQRRLAERLGVDFTTVARGYVEAQRRGLVESRGSQGTFVRALTTLKAPPPSSRPAAVDFTMNLPPEPVDRTLLDRMEVGLDIVRADIVGSLRYEDFGGRPADKAAGAQWLGREGIKASDDLIYVVPGAHPALFGVMSILARPGDTLLSANLTFPIIRTVAAQLGLTLVGLKMDEEGIDPEALSEACENGKPKAIYVNPTLHNPTARTMSLARRDAIAHIARRWSIPIVEDNAYGFIYETPPTPFASLAPELTWHVASLSKCLGAGLRTAFVLAPNRQSGWILASLLRCITGMASPLTVALATQWIQDGTADALARFIRMESAARQAIARQAFPPALLTGDPAGFHGWLALPNGWTRSTFVGQMRTSGLGIVPSDAFIADIDAPEAVRICLGGPISQPELQRAVQFAAHTLTERPAIAVPFL